MTTKHTPTPWEVNPRHKLIVQVIDDEEYGRTIAECGYGSSLDADHEANAAFIVKAVNCHDDLVSALQNLIDRDLIKDKDGDHMQEILDILNKAKGE